MVKISKVQKDRKAKIYKARAVNPLVSKQLRNGRYIEQKKKRDEPLIRAVKEVGSSFPEIEFNRQDHLVKCRKIKAANATRKRNSKRRQIIGTQAAAWARRNMKSQQVEAAKPTTSRPISPEEVLATKRQARVSDEGYRHINNLVAQKFDAPLTPKWKLEKARKQLENVIRYEVNDLGDVCLESIADTMKERKRRLDMENDERGNRVVFSLDKGRGRVTSTVSLVHHPRPCSYYNHLPLQVWNGSDSYNSLKEHAIGKPVEVLSEHGSAMTFPCLWCPKRFMRGAAADRDSIDFVVYKDQSVLEVEEEIRKYNFAAPKEPIIAFDRDYVIPPILHAKIKIGNELFSRLLAAAGESPSFRHVISKWQLNVNRHEEGIIYSRFHGNDIKRMCKAIDDLSGNEFLMHLIQPSIGVSNATVYQNVIAVMRTFNAWCEVVSTTETNLADDKLQEICCKDSHNSDRTCCRTALLGKALDSIGGFGTSALVHVMVMHLGPFIWKHRLIGAVAEEGIEAVHSKLALGVQRHKRKPAERIKNAVKWQAIDVLLSDKKVVA